MSSVNITAPNDKITAPNDKITAPNDKITDHAHIVSQYSDCATCQNFGGFEERPTCRAFPGGIPLAVLQAKVQHRAPIEGDHGVQYQPLPDGLHHHDIHGQQIEQELEQAK